MTSTAETVERLRQMDAQAARDSGGRHQAGESVFAAAADHMESLARERNRAVEALERTLRNFRLLLEQKPVRDAAETIAEAERTLAQIDTESEGER